MSNVDPVLLWTPKLCGVKCDPVTEFNGKVSDLVKRCVLTMHHYSGVGLAAAQIGQFSRIAVAEVEGKREVLINAELLHMKGDETGFEGCLSLPGVTGSGNRVHNGGRLNRCTVVEYSTYTMDGEKVIRTAEDLMARVIQHEIDHFEGIFILDRLSSMYRTIVMRNFESFKTQLMGGATPV